MEITTKQFADYYECFFNTADDKLRHVRMKTGSEEFRKLVNKKMYRNLYVSNIRLVDEEGKVIYA